MGMTYKRPRIPHYDDPVAVGQRLHEAREAAGLSQRELAFPGCVARPTSLESSAVNGFRRCR